ncbi:MAG: bifunctional demethylmenaquinone methyltransferase/2-methoxy-6-polyprenyl-1,4-benzoquinol methylase UbiE [Bacteroidota bacterium]
MTSPVHSECSSRSVDVQRMFDEIAPRYDLLNHLLSFGLDFYWRRRAVGELKLQPGATILDIAIGTGDLAFAAFKLNPKAIVGIDPAERMLKRCFEKSIKRRALNFLELVCGTAEALPMKDRSFHGAMVAFGVRNFSDIQTGLNEIHRVLKPGAPFVALELTQPRNRVFKKFFTVYFEHVVPILGRLISGSPYAYRYLPDSVSTFPAHDSFAALMCTAGFRDVWYRPLTLGTCTLYHGIKEST